MKVKIIRNCMIGPGNPAKAGKIVTVDDQTGKALLVCGAAKEVETAEPKTGKE